MLWLRCFIAALTLVSCGTVLSDTNIPTSSDMVLWYRQPAKTWHEALPLGNGLIGARLFGGVEKERIALNESSFWSGRPHNYDAPEAGKYFPKVRDLVLAGKFPEAEQLANQHLLGRPAGQQAFQPLGDLLLSQHELGEVENYRRELDMATGVARITYRANGINFTREVFVSYPDKVLVVRITGDKPGSVSLRSGFRSPYLDKVTAKPYALVMSGSWKSSIPITDVAVGKLDGPGLRFQAVLEARPEGGTVEAQENHLAVKGADAVTLVLAAATSYVNYNDIGGDPSAACAKVLADARKKDYAALRRRHAADFGTLIGRVQLRVGDPALEKQPTDERLKAIREGSVDPGFQAQCFQMGRYLLVSSSRAGGQPANLQGIWNEATSPNWGSKYTININTEMNYWPAEVCNLSECHQPLFDMLKDVAVTGARTAKSYYNCNGWVAHHNIDLWRGTAPVDAACYGMWPLGGAWLSLHIWEHYLFTGDVAFLKEYYPVMKGAARFLQEYLVDYPTNHWLVTPVSMSPEHGYQDRQGRVSVLSPAPTMDIAIMRELFPACMEAGRLLGVDAEFRAKLDEALKRLPPYRVNSRGCLQEWIEDWNTQDQGHCLSPYFTFFPGQSITLASRPELVGAVVKWMETRGCKGGGWPLAWDAAIWARLRQGDKVALCLQSMMKHSIGPNLNHPGANQSDANFGLTAAIAEALLQSHLGEVHLLPALPSGWGDGEVRGLRARGGLEVSMQWQGGKLRSAELRAEKTTVCNVRSGNKTVEVKLRPGRPLRLNAELIPER